MAPRCAPLLVLSGLLFACASVHPDFDQKITSAGGWRLFIASRYGCDTTNARDVRTVVREPAPPAPTPRQEPPQAQPATRGPALRGRTGRTPNPNPPAAPQPRFVRPRLLGAMPCGLAYPMPSEVRGYKIEGGIREEWLGGGVLMYQFEGPHPAQLRVVRVGP